MVFVAQINLIVADLERSRDFYERLGMTFRARSRHASGPAEAWVSTSPGVTLVLHSTEFASWWDASSPNHRQAARNWTWSWSQGKVSTPRLRR